MGIFIKIVSLVLLLLLVVFGAVSDRLVVTTIFNSLDVAPYIRILAILGLIIVIFAAWGYKRRMETSQKYLLADQILADAQATAKRRERTSMLLDEKLKSDFARKVQALEEQLEQMKADHQKKMVVLKTQNVQLKEAVSKLMRVLKNKKPADPKKSKTGSLKPPASPPPDQTVSEG